MRLNYAAIAPEATKALAGVNAALLRAWSPYQQVEAATQVDIFWPGRRRLRTDVFTKRKAIASSTIFGRWEIFRRQTEPRDARAGR